MARKPDFQVHGITRVPDTQSQQSRTVWTNRIGAAWVNTDGSINVRLNMLPISGEMQLRVPDPAKEDDNRGTPETTTEEPAESLSGHQVARHD